MGSSLKEALKLFAKARPPGVYNPKYLEALKNSYQPDLILAIPNPPKWETSNYLNMCYCNNS